MEGVRAKVRQRYGRVLEDGDKARRLEVHTFNWTVAACIRRNIKRYWDNPRFRYLYTTRALSLEFNLKNPRNPGLAERVKASDNEYLRKFANMTPHEMFPELYAPIYERLAAKQLRKMAVSHQDAPDGIYQCRACKSKKTQYACLQTRSADEPMTTYVSCLQCGRRWKE